MLNIIDGERKRNIAIIVNPISGKKEAYNLYKTKLRPLLKVTKMNYKVFSKHEKLIFRN